MANAYRCSIHQKEDQLFREWQETNYPDTDPSLFQFDGLHFCGSPSKESGAWQIVPRGCTDELHWIASSIRPVFLTRDYNAGRDGEAVDCRFDTGLDNRYQESILASGFHHTLASMIYFLFDKDIMKGEVPTLEELKADDERGFLNAFYYYRTWARINVKKLAGGETCEESELRQIIEKDKPFINRQLDLLYGANVQICCDGRSWSIADGSQNAIMSFLYERHPDLKGFKSNPNSRDTWVYYSESAHVVILHTFHPSRHTPEDEYPAFTELAAFLKQNPGFLRRVMPD